MDYRTELAKLIKIENVSENEIASYITPIADQLPGDYTLPCFRFAKAMRKAPAAIAEELKNSIGSCSFIEKIEAVNGYLNFFLNKSDAAEAVLSKILKEGFDYGSSDIGKGKTICIDYSSVNIAKPFHIGHLGTTAIGSALYKIL
jgi:Arginyl-tRNA synthetase